MSIRSVLVQGVHEGASDIHLSAGKAVIFRIQGAIVHRERLGCSSAELESELVGLCGGELSACIRSFREFDGAFEIPAVARFRTHVFHHLNGLTAVFRVVPSAIPSMESLGIPPALRDVVELDRGLVLVSGPTGAGKSTTLASVVDQINHQRPVHIVTLENPIEFLHASRRASVHQREIGTHTRSCADALRAVLREDPNVILIGELRDSETIHLALTAAETGHLVLATVHSGGTCKTIERIVDVFPAAQQSQVRSMLAESLEVVVSQVLCKATAGQRVAAFEVLVATPAVRTLIRESKTHQLAGLMQSSRTTGMQTMEAHIRDLVAGGVVDSVSVAQKPGRLGWL